MTITSQISVRSALKTLRQSCEGKDVVGHKTHHLGDGNCVRVYNAKASDGGILIGRRALRYVVETTNGVRISGPRSLY